MKLTALEIKQQTFAKSLRGYDVAEVQSFLNVVSSEWEHLSNKLKDQEGELQRLNDKLQHYQKVEEALHETLQAAKLSSEERINSSKQDAQNRIAKADLEAEKIIRESQQERQAIRQSIQRLLERRQEIIRGMKSYLDLATESLESFKQNASSTYSLPQEEQATQKDDKSSSSSKNDHKKSNTDSKSKSSPTAPNTDDLDHLLEDLDE
ncbi:MAG: DivIVA domain-containing protein [Balneolales bacterium]